MKARFPAATCRALATAGCALAVAGCALFVAGCATYAPLPLPTGAGLAVALPGSGQPLDMNAVATVAVLNSPDLQVARARAGVTDAQAFAAGLLPDPQLSATLDETTDRGQGYINAYGLGLSLDLQALLTHPARRAAADAAREQARLELLWQEWQTIAEARALYVQQIIATDRLKFLTDAQEAYTTQASRSQRALQAGDSARDQAGGDLALLADIAARLGAAQRSALQSDQSLHALLGVAPGVPVPLQTLRMPALADETSIDGAVARLPDSRPDLTALQAGYRSQEQLLRRAVLAQFPMISLGFNKARDTSDVHTVGLGVTLNLPLFDRGRGDIAVQRATRVQLRTEYQARLVQTMGDIWRLRAEIAQLQNELQQLNERLPRLAATADTAHTAYDAGDFSAATYLTLLNTYLTSRSAQLDLTQSLWTDAIALSTLLGTPLQQVAD